MTQTTQPSAENDSSPQSDSENDSPPQTDSENDSSPFLHYQSSYFYYQSPFTLLITLQTLLPISILAYESPFLLMNHP